MGREWRRAGQAVLIGALLMMINTHSPARLRTHTIAYCMQILIELEAMLEMPWVICNSLATAIKIGFGYDAQGDRLAGYHRRSHSPPKRPTRHCSAV